ncbi:L-rhamnose mutarotase [Streptomyces venezuelae]|uniref:L-rhamnose mutarotase n=1 Tax=Streptomyces venezuelae TaxID=54571 RepID=UPI001F23A904|nr:L-rhamnose mutarotase [Streptomyces venezuelae]
MRRVCFLLKVRAGRVEEYRARHEHVWAEMLTALSAAGWHNYSLFLREDGLLVGYLETPDFDRARAAMEATEVNARWQAEMAASCGARAAGGPARPHRMKTGAGPRPDGAVGAGRTRWDG